MQLLALARSKDTRENIECSYQVAMGDFVENLGIYNNNKC